MRDPTRHPNFCMDGDLRRALCVKLEVLALSKPENLSGIDLSIFTQSELLAWCNKVFVNKSSSMSVNVSTISFILSYHFSA